MQGGRRRECQATINVASDRMRQSRRIFMGTAPGSCWRSPCPCPILASDGMNELLRFCDVRKLASSGFSVHRAWRRRADELHRIVFGKGEIDEKFRIVDFDLEHLRLHRLLERQRKVQREHSRLGIVVEPIVDRLVEHVLLPLAVDVREGEVVELLQQIDVDLGERLQFLAGELALGLAALMPIVA